MKKGLKHFRENEKLENLYNIIYNIDIPKIILD